MHNVGVTLGRDGKQGPLAKSKAARWILAVLTFGILGSLVGGCAEPAVRQPGADLESLLAELHRMWDTKEEVQRAKLLSEIGRLGKAEPDLIIPELVERLRTERRSDLLNLVIATVDFTDAGLDRGGRKAAGLAARDVWLRRLRTHFPKLQVNANFRGSGVALKGQLELNVVRTFTDDEQEARLLAIVADVLSRSGVVSLMPVVTRPGTEGAAASLWEGDAASYDDFIKKHEAPLREDFERNERHLAGDGVYRLALRGGDSPERKLTPVVLYHAEARDERFTNDEFVLDGKRDLKKRTNILDVQIVETRAAAFDALCLKHKGRELALVQDEQAELIMPMPASTAQGRLVVLGPMGTAATATTGPQPSESDQLLFRLVKSAQPGYIQAPIQVIVKDNAPDRMLTPISACLVSVGSIVVPFLEPLQAAGGKVSERVRWIQGEIRRLSREPGR